MQVKPGSRLLALVDDHTWLGRQCGMLQPPNNLLLSVGHFMTGCCKNALQLNEEHWLWYIRHEIEMSHCNGNRFDAQFSCVPANRKQAGAANYRLGE